MSLIKNQVFRFGEFELRVSSRSLIREGKEIPLGSKAFEVLVYLLRRPGEVLSKEQLLKAVWPKSFVEEGNLSQHIYALRKAMTDRSGYILTVPGQGYQFTAPVQTVTPADDALQLRQAVDQLESLDGASSPAAANLSQDGLGGILVQRVRERTQLVIEETFPVDVERAAYPPAPAAVLEGKLGRGRLLATVAAAMAILCLCGAAYWLLIEHRKPMPVRVASYAQITHDGHDKYLSGTDGSRLYFTQRSPQLAEQIAVSGGVPAPVPIPIPNSWIGEVSPDGSTVLIVSEAGGMTSAYSLWSSAVLGGSLRRLADATTGTWSPDGESVAYATQDGGVYTMRTDGTGVHKLASVGGFVDALSWSPDGEVIRFSVKGKLWQISSQGNGLKELLKGWHSGSARSDGGFALDGRFFFVCDGQIWVLDQRRALFSNAPAEPVALTSGPMQWTEPVASKDGKKLFAVGATLRGELVRFDAQSHKFQPFLGGVSAEFVSYSRDGKSLVYVSYPQGVLWERAAEGGVPIQLTSPPVYPKLARWSPDGRQIVFVDRSPEAAAALYLVSSQGGGRPRRLLPDDSQPENDPTWSPDGTKIVFSTSPEEITDPRAVLRMVDVAGGAVSTVPGSDGLFSPRWSPDGRSIVASTLDSLSMKVFNIATQQWTSLNSGPVAFPEWSADSRSIEYVSWLDDPTVRRIAATGGQPEVVADLKGEQYTGFYTSWMGLDPTGAPLMLLDRGSKDIYALTLESR
jgi:DNA-binding winged helix-turn-helix (wHTH) protein/Tol biopolymer transport system component